MHFTLYTECLCVSATDRSMLIRGEQEKLYINLPARLEFCPLLAS